MTLLKDTADSLDDIIDFYLDNGLDGGIGTQMLNLMETHYRHYDEEMLNQLFTEDIIQVLSDVSKKLQRIQENHENRGILSFTEELELYINNSGVTKGNARCPFLTHSLYINFKGYVTGCCSIKDYSQYNFGIVGVNSMEDIIKQEIGLGI